MASSEGPAPGAVDFDALNAALGGAEALEAEGGEQTADAVDAADELDHLSPAATESSGRSSAQYASSRPHTIPPTRAPHDDRDVPAVIVAQDDTTPAAPPLGMTTPLGAALPPLAPPSNPHVAPPGPRVDGLPTPFPGIAAPPPVHSYPPRPSMNPTMPMVERPRRPRTPTVVVRRRGPSVLQKLAAFMLLSLLVTAVGIAVIWWRQPDWLRLEPAPEPSAEPSAAPSASGAAALSAATAAASSSSAAPPGSGSAPLKPRMLRPPPRPSAPTH